MIEEGPPAPKVLRMVYFVGAGCKFLISFCVLISLSKFNILTRERAIDLAVLCTFAINKWLEMEKKSNLKQQQLEKKNQQGDGALFPSDSVHKAMK